MSEEYPAIILFGPPGSGKGTVGKKLATVTDQYHLSSGDVFRGISKESELGKLQSSYSDRGLLVPDEITVQVCLSYIKGLMLTNRYYPEKQHLILDGLPRTLNQAKLLSNSIFVKKIIVLNVDNHAVLIERLKKRAKQEGRLDDMNESVLIKRMEVYKNQTEELLEYYPKSSHIYIQADQTPINVFKDVLNSIAEILD